MAVFENRSGAYFMYVSSGSAENRHLQADMASFGSGSKERMTNMNDGRSARTKGGMSGQGQAEALLANGLRFHQAGRLAEAEECYRRLLALIPDHADSLHLLGDIFYQRGRYDLAVDSIGRAIASNGTVPFYYYNLGNAFQALGRQDEALAAYDTAIRIMPDLAEAHYNRGNALQNLGRPGEALAAYGTAIKIKPDYAQAHANLGLALQVLGRPDAALAAYDAAIKIKPTDFEAHYNRGLALQALDRPDEALAAYDTAVRLKPDFAEARNNRGLALLLKGEFEKGWQDYEWRWRSKDWSGGKPRHQTLPRWTGEPADGRTVLLWSEQGMGDTIQCLRYLPRVAAMGWKIVAELPRELIQLATCLKAADITIAAIGDPLPTADLQCPFLSLPAICGTIPWAPPSASYLRAEPDLSRAWRARLGKESLNIGIVWQGNPSQKNDRNRSARLAEFRPLSAIDGVHLVSLQKNYGTEQLENLPDGMRVDRLGPDYDSGGFHDTAAVIAGLDLVIGVDTAVAHLAGSLGVPTWLLLCKVPDWRWLMEREDSPWYPSMRLFRQEHPGDWSAVFHRIAEALRPLVKP